MKKIESREDGYIRDMTLFFTKHIKKRSALFSLVICSSIALSFCNTLCSASLSADNILEKIRILNPHVTVFPVGSVRQDVPLGSGINGEVYKGQLLRDVEILQSGERRITLEREKYVALKKVDLNKARENLREWMYDFNDDDLLGAICFEVDNLFWSCHANIVELYGVALLDGHLHIVTKLYQTKNLQKHLDENTLLPLERRFSTEQHLKWAMDITCGLSYLHDNEIIHRDLKADNIFIGDDNVAIIGDLGASKRGDCPNKLVRKGNQSRKVKAPESVVDWKYSDERSDIWALGRLFVQLITGEEDQATTWEWMKHTILVNLEEKGFSPAEVDEVIWLIDKAERRETTTEDDIRVDANYPLERLNDHNEPKELRKHLKEKLLKLITDTLEIKGESALSSPLVFSSQLTGFKKLTKSCLANDSDLRPSMKEVMGDLKSIALDNHMDYINLLNERNSAAHPVPTYGGGLTDYRKCYINDIRFLRVLEVCEDVKKRINKEIKTLRLGETLTEENLMEILRWFSREKANKHIQHITSEKKEIKKRFLEMVAAYNRNHSSDRIFKNLK